MNHDAEFVLPNKITVKTNIMSQSKSIICLGDSYTIGESVALHQSFPYQLVQMLRKNNLHFTAPEIIAKTGWTSFELLEQINQNIFENSYDYATLLVGVNNQYRGLSTENFGLDFEILLKKAIDFVNNQATKVIVISIPDWGVTPFAADRDTMQIANEIDAFNGVCELLAQKYQTHFINITDSTRLAKNDKTLLTSDMLHYSEKEHFKWASKVFKIINSNT